MTIASRRWARREIRLGVQMGELGGAGDAQPADHRGDADPVIADDHGPPELDAGIGQPSGDSRARCRAARSCRAWPPIAWNRRRSRPPAARSAAAPISVSRVNTPSGSKAMSRTVSWRNSPPSCTKRSASARVSRCGLVVRMQSGNHTACLKPGASAGSIWRSSLDRHGLDPHAVAPPQIMRGPRRRERAIGVIDIHLAGVADQVLRAGGAISGPIGVDGVAEHRRQRLGDRLDARRPRRAMKRSR